MASLFFRSGGFTLPCDIVPLSSGPGQARSRPRQPGCGIVGFQRCSLSIDRLERRALLRFFPRGIALCAAAVDTPPPMTGAWPITLAAVLQARNRIHDRRDVTLLR